MHLADAILSPTVCAFGWLGSGLGMALSTRKVAEVSPHFMRMGLLSAFALAAGAIQFSLPGTGLSVHFTGALFLAMILGPAHGFMALASLTFLQSLLLSEGGLAALGCNLLNTAAPVCFIVTPMLRWVLGYFPTKRSQTLLFILAGIISMGVSGALVAIEIFLSKKSDLGLGFLLGFNVPVQMAVGMLEGAITSFLLRSYWQVTHGEVLEHPTATT